MTRRKITVLVIFIGVVLIGLVTLRIYSKVAINKNAAPQSSEVGECVKVMQVVRRDIAGTLEFSSNLESIWKADISAEEDGKINRVYVDEGDTVDLNNAIASLDNKELAAQVAQAEGDLTAVKANLWKAEKNLRRNELLTQQGAMAVQNLDDAKAEYNLRLGEIQGKEANLTLLKIRLENTRIVAPRSGIIVKRYLQAGSYVKKGNPIVAIADTSSLLAKAVVGEYEMKDLIVGGAASVKLDAFPEQNFNGRVSKISPAADSLAHNFIAEINLDNPQNLLKPGMFAKVVVSGQIHKNALAVPLNALVVRGDKKMVFVVDNNRAQQKIIKLGNIENGWVEVVEGLQEGDTIVVAGQNKLKDGSTVSIKTEVGEG